jgi:glycosyltransferase involved in cell wall biosynthesis
MNSYHKPAWVHRNAFSLEMLALSEAAYQHRSLVPGTIVVGYGSGTPTHDRDFQIVRPALISILKRYPQTELWLVGPLDSGNDWGVLDHRVRQIPLVPWRNLPALLARFDINIAPLVVENPFGQSKSEIKYMEAGLVRVPTIASPTNAYQLAIQSGENGFLASNDDEWIESISRLIEEPDLRIAMGERAHAHALQRYHPLVRAAELVQTLNDIRTHICGESLGITISQEELGPQQVNRPIHHLTPELELNPTLTQMALYTLRHRGLKTMLMQVWIFFRRGLARLIPYRKVHDQS